MMNKRLTNLASQIFLLSLSALIAIGATELIVRNIVRYPPRPETRIFHVNDKLGEFDRIYWNAPYDLFWDVEAGNRVFKLNNVGLPSTDVDTTKNGPYIFLLGSSWVEALQVPPERAAASLLQKRLNDAGSPAQVLNLGSSGADPYVEWFRSIFFERYFRPSNVVLVFEPWNAHWLMRHPQPLNFALPSFFGTEERRKGVRALFSRLRAISSLVNLIENGRQAPSEVPLAGAQPTHPPVAVPFGREVDTESWENLKACVWKFQERYGRRFLLISIMTDSTEVSEFAGFCRAKGIRFVGLHTLVRPENRFNGTGHLNERGNKEFGEILYDAIMGIHED